MEAWKDVRKVCVIGAGTMGSGIAAHLANLGFQVSLLDATQTSVTEAFDRTKSARPPHFFVPERANEIRLGNVSENLDWTAGADWVIEAIVEKLDAKQALYAQLDPIIGPNTLISTNTSGLEIGQLAEGRSESFRRRFMGTHFFNPPRYLKLLELIPTPETSPELVEGMTQLLEERVGRRVVLAKDTPGFIANRYGMLGMFYAIHVAERLHLSVEEVDAITGPFLGRPKSASFRLNDIVGLDVMRDIAANLQARCPQDPQTATLNQPHSTVHLLARGWIGEKSGHGYYRRQGEELLVLDLQTFAYRQRREVTFPSLVELSALPLGERIRKALKLRDEVGEFLRRFLVPALRYADSLKEEVSYSIKDFDRVMEWGFGWEMGPFAMIDAIGPENLGLAPGRRYEGKTQLAYSGGYEPILEDSAYATLADFPVVSSGEHHRLHDMGDGVHALAMTAKMGVISPAVVEELIHLLDFDNLDRFVLTSDGRAFSAGFDLKFFLSAIQEDRFADITKGLARLQRLGELLETKTCVAAVFGHCVGAGLEVALSCSHIAALAETNIGLPESKVGLLPGGRGTTLARINNQHNLKRLTEVAINLASGVTATNADSARVKGYLRPTDVTVYHPDRLLTEAKKLVLSAQPSKRPAWSSIAGPLGGMIDRALEGLVSKGEFTPQDCFIGHRIKQVFARSTSYEDALVRERQEFLELCHDALSLARLRSMVETKKPFRN